MFKIFEKLGGEEAVLEILQQARQQPANGKPFPGKFAVKKWKSEGQIPPINAVILQKWCDRLRIEWAHEDFEALAPNKPDSSASRDVAA